MAVRGRACTLTHIVSAARKRITHRNQVQVWGPPWYGLTYNNNRRTQFRRSVLPAPYG